MPGYSKDGLVHCSQVSERLDGDPDVEGGPGGPKGATPEAAAALRVADERKVNKLRLIIAEGEECWVKVVRVDGERIALSMKAVSQEDGTDLDPSNALAGAGGGGGGSDEPPPLWSIHQATVTSVRPFGLFVSMSGYRKHGLVFISQVSSYLGLDRGATDEEKIEALQEVAKTGESVYVKVIGVGTDEQGRLKIACSMRVVSQSDGTDQDPNNLVASGDPKTGGSGDAMGGQGGGSLPGASNAPIASIDDPLYLQRFQIHNTYAKTGGTEGYDLLVDDGNDPVPPPVPGPAGAADVAAGAAAALDGDGGDSPLQDGDRALDALLSTRVSSREEALRIIKELSARRGRERSSDKRHKRDRERSSDRHERRHRRSRSRSRSRSPERRRSHKHKRSDRDRDHDSGRSRERERERERDGRGADSARDRDDERKERHRGRHNHSRSDRKESRSRRRSSSR